MLFSGSTMPAIGVCVILAAACSTRTDESAPGGLFGPPPGGGAGIGGSAPGGRGGASGAGGSGTAGSPAKGGAGGSTPTCSVPAWQPGKVGDGAPAYTAGTLVSYEGKIYSVDHDLTYAHESCPPAGPDRQAWCNGQYDYTYVRDC